VPGHGLGARAAIGQVAQGAADPLRETSAMPFRAATLLRATLAFAFCLSTYAATLRALNPRLAFAQSVALAETLLEAARKFRLDPTLVMAVVSVESSWNPHAVSYSGARGLGQLMPGTARYLGVGDSESGRENLRGTVRYLHELIHSFHQSPDPIRSALSGYNAGPYTVKLNGGLPLSGNRHYVSKVFTTWHAVTHRIAVAAAKEPQPVHRALDLNPATPAQAEQAQESYWGAN
jgi:soluble lytic murein transglycosylase-like protein